jgi:pimeloyl-ACP methyl ester carboxylesterase
VIAYAHGTTGIADACAPTRDRAGTPVHGYNAYAYPLLGRWLKAGYAVVRTDYQGLGTPGAHQYLDGPVEGRAVLDAVRAARRVAPLSRRVALAGHSQGGHAALWAASLAPRWTPELAVRGTYAFAPASHLGEQSALLPSISSPLGGLGGLAAMIVRGLDAARPELMIPLGLGDRAAALYPRTLTDCLPELGAADAFGALTGTEFLRAGVDTGPVTAAIGANDPEALRIRTPVRIAQGTADTTVLPVFTEQLAGEYRARGNRVALRRFVGVTHGGIVDAAARDSLQWLRARLGR